MFLEELVEGAEFGEVGAVGSLLVAGQVLLDLSLSQVPLCETRINGVHQNHSFPYLK